MYSGKPILVTLDGFPSILNDAKCGKFISPEEPSLLAKEILKFSKMDKITLKKIGENGQKYLLQNLSYDKLTDKFLKIIDE
jgi:glycosyltransferase involved in cell wall biosynthesis